MFVALFKQRVSSLLLFFKEYTVLIYCFTFIFLQIVGVRVLEITLFDQQEFSVSLLMEIILPILVYIVIAIVSYRVFCRVYFIGTILKTLLVTSLFVSMSTVMKFNNISKNIQKVQSFTGQKVWITGVVTSAEKSRVFLFDSKTEGVGKALIRFSQMPDLHAGQSCKIKGKVVQPKSFEDFDYKRYLFRKGVYSIIEVEEYTCWNGGNIFLELRYILERVVEKALPEPEASLLIGIMFGSKRIFMSDFNSSLSSSGVSHIIAASGYNVALVAQLVDALFKRNSSRVVLLIKIILIWAFSVFSGLSSSLVRASTMSTISLIAQLFGREGNKGATLILCVALLILVNPFIIYDIGFLFSFVSVFGLMFLPKCFENVRSKFFKDSILPTLTSILFTIPISVSFFGKVSLISILMNIIVVPVLASTIFWGLLSTIIGLIIPIKFLFLIPYIQLNIFKKLVILSSTIPMVNIGINEYIVVFGVYLFLIIFCLLKFPLSYDNYYYLKAKRL